MMKNLFQMKDFTRHSGDKAFFKIECDALTADDWACVAKMVAAKIKFSEVFGVERGGIPFSTALVCGDHCSKAGPLLLVDDVLSTGASMEQKKLWAQHLMPQRRIIGVVLFSLGPCPNWITPIFEMW